jgi:hypothetical protein
VKSLIVADDVILHQEEGDAFLLHVASGRYFGLNRSGLLVWSALLDGADPVQALAARWPDKSPASLRSDAEELVRQLVQAGLISEVADEPDP